jgi:hypothetical protein
MLKSPRVDKRGSVDGPKIPFQNLVSMVTNGQPCCSGVPWWLEMQLLQAAAM